VNVKTIGITTNAAGAFDQNFRLTGQVVAIAIDTGDLSTPDITLSDLATGTTVLAVTGLAADAVYHPKRLAQLNTTGADIVAAAGPPAVDNVYDSPVVLGTLRVLVAGAGDTKSGTIRIAYRG